MLTLNNWNEVVQLGEIWAHTDMKAYKLGWQYLTAQHSCCVNVTRA